MSELASRRNQIMPQGWDELRRKAIAEANERMNEAFRRHERIEAEIRDKALADSLPRFDPARESLARGEFRDALADTKGSQAVLRLMAIAERGSREAAAIAFTDYARTILEAKHGVSGQEYVDAMRAIRSVAAAAALEHPQNEKQLLAAAIYRDVGKLGAVRAAAATYVGEEIKRAGGEPLYAS